MKASEKLNMHFETKTNELEYWDKQSEEIKQLCKMFYMQGASDYQDIVIGRGCISKDLNKASV